MSAMLAAIGYFFLPAMRIGCFGDGLVLDSSCFAFAAFRAFLNRREPAGDDDQHYAESHDPENDNLACTPLYFLVFPDILPAVGERPDGEQFFRRLSVGTDFIDSECSEAQAAVIVSGTEGWEHLIMHDLRALSIREDTFYTRTRHDTHVMAVEHKENEHAGVLSLASYSPSLEKLVGEVEGVGGLFDSGDGYDGHLDVGLLIKHRRTTIEPLDGGVREKRIGVSDIVLLSLLLGVRNGRRRIDRRSKGSQE